VAGAITFLHPPSAGKGSSCRPHQLQFRHVQTPAAKLFVPHRLWTHSKLDPHLVLDCLTVGSVLWQKLRQKFVEAFGIVSVMFVMELLLQKGFVHELLMVRLHKKAHLAVPGSATKSQANLTNFRLRPIFRFAPIAAVLVIVKMAFENAVHRPSKIFVSPTGMQPQCPTQPSFHPFCIHFC
jgi:hypothetical protein